MLNDRIQVDPEAVRGCATELAGTGDRIAHALITLSGLAVGATGWHADAALDELAAAMHAYLGAVGGRAVDTAARLRTAAGEYEAADDRAARRTVALR